jgi:hypothetical protein
MAPTLRSFPFMTFMTSSMSCHTLERLALARFLVVLVVLFVGLTSTSIDEEAEAPTAASFEPRPMPSEFMSTDKLWSTSTIDRTCIGAVGVVAIEPDEEALVLKSGT